MQFTFTTRSQYFTYRQEWKARYFGLILEIRKSALANREANRAFSKSGSDEAHTALWHTQSAHASLKVQAGSLLAERAASKVEAGRQRALNVRGSSGEAIEGSEGRGAARKGQVAQA